MGQAICDLHGLILEQEEHRSLPLLKTKQGVQVNRGTIDFTLKLCNPHVVSLQAQMEIAKHRMIRAVKKTIMAQRFAEDFFPNSEQSVIQSEAEQSETVISEAGILLNYIFNIRLNLRQKPLNGPEMSKRMKLRIPYDVNTELLVIDHI